ncbi:MAG TPA: putative lipid II flippase FtsW [Actinomycetota bacterium]|nr:putative lipid II flippase FtsW [Actinomycetota bacterium]
MTLLLGTTAFLVATGLVMVLSASSVSAFADYGDSFMFVQRQAIYAVIGVLALVVTSRLRYDAWKRLALPLLILTLAMLVVVLHPASGIEVYGSSRWFHLGPVTVQPSELAKFTVVVFAASVFTRKWSKLDDLGHVAMPMLPVTVIVCGSVMLQPDLGTTVIIAGTLFLVMFVAGVRMRYLTIAGIVGAVIAAGLIMGADYRRIRFLSFLNPWEDAQNTGYQLIQSLIALGSGGFTGVGLGASRQKWEYVPNAHTDFIFSILGEELGLLGEIVVLIAFGALLYAGIAIATRTNDVFGRLLASGIAAWFGLQTLVNLGAVTGLLPVTGVPLPFLSYGGSSLVVSLAAVGVLVSITRAPMRGGPEPGGRRPSSGRSRVGAAGRTSTAATARSGHAR